MQAECKTLWRVFFSKYKELYEIPPFLDEWVLLSHWDEKPLWYDMAAVCGFNKPRASDDACDEMRIWEYRDVKLPDHSGGWYFYNLSHADGATLSPSEVRAIPGLDNTEDEWEHYRPVDLDEADMRHIIHLRRRVSTCASHGASHMCKMKWGPDGQ